jgi:hypothetical protein
MWVVLGNRGPDKGENFIDSSKRRHEDTHLGSSKIQRVWSGNVEIGKNPLFPGVLWGFLKTSEEEKGPQITYPENFIYSTFYLLINPDNFVLRGFFPVLLHLGDSHFWPKILSLEEMQKGQIDKSRLMQKLDGVSDPKYESCCVFKIMNTISTNIKVFPGSRHIFFYKRQKLALEIFGTSETSAKRGEIVDFRRP